MADRQRAGRARIRKEALALAKLNHAHIGAVYDFGTEDGLDFLVMEYISGATLADRLVHSKFAERDVLTFGAQVARALEEAHDRGAVHRDLRPGNIMMSQKGAAKVLDFGLARMFDPTERAPEAQTVTETRHIVGTPPYMAPEQLRNETVDARSDIHALGPCCTRWRPAVERFQRTRALNSSMHPEPGASHATSVHASDLAGARAHHAEMPREGPG